MLSNKFLTITELVAYAVIACLLILPGIPWIVYTLTLILSIYLILNITGFALIKLKEIKLQKQFLRAFIRNTLLSIILIVIPFQFAFTLYISILIVLIGTISLLLNLYSIFKLFKQDN